MKRIAPGIRAQFVVASALLVATTAVSAGWSAWALRDVSRVVDETVRGSERTTAATTTLTSALEDEDDALLLSLNDEARGRRELAAERALVDAATANLDELLDGAEGGESARGIANAVAAYHAAADDLLEHVHDKDARARYDAKVTPTLQRAVSDTNDVRDQRFKLAQRVAASASQQATRATQILSGVTALAVVISLLVALYLARNVVLPIRDLTQAVVAMRRGDFGSRVPEGRGDELGRLADAFNAMAEDLEAFRRANVGEVIRAKETLEATLAALPDAVVVIEPEGVIASTNPRALLVLGDRDGAARALDALPLPERTRDSIAAALRGEPRVSMDAVDLAQAVDVDLAGETRRLLPRVVPIRGLAGGRRGVVLVLSDVTDLARLDAMRTELVAVASHELRTPLTTLRMTLLLLRERAASLGERDRELVGTALLGVEQLAGTVDAFLDLTRIEAGQLRLDWDRVDVGNLARREIEKLRPACDEARVDVTLDAPTDLAEVRGDPSRLHVVVANVLANALKYTPRGGTIALVLCADGERVVLSIEDSGPGVPAELRERIFEKFFRVEHHKKGGDAGVRGSGIGLYIAREVVAAHGGAIVCEAGRDGGARFVVTLPIA